MGNRSFGKGYIEGYEAGKKKSDKDNRVKNIITLITGIIIGAFASIIKEEKKNN